MEMIESVLVMLGIVLLSNVLSRFLPNIAVPLIQIALGVIISIFTSLNYFELSSEIFMLMFLAPLLFNDGVNVDKKTFFEERKAIVVLSILLVFVTVGLLGTVIHFLIPAMPWAGSFALAAALAPTDAVAVSALAEKVKIPHKMMHTLEGESLINDASGLVSFQFAAAAILTGTFSMFEAGISFVLISLGGILVGLICSFIAIQVIKWLRNLGIENTTSFILLELLLPFFIFIVSEELHVNGILAVVSAGLLYSTSYKKVNPEIAQLHVLSKNTWSVFSFTLNGLVFVLLGIHLPSSIHGVWINHNISNLMLIFFILVITIILLLIRFICFWVFKNFENEPFSSKKERFKQSALYTISGVRGAITLVSALSLPILISDGSVFLERDLLISIASGVILSTLLLANFTMPLFAEKKEKEVKKVDHEKELVILRQVVQDLNKEVTPENQQAIMDVIKMYHERIVTLDEDEHYAEQEDKLRELTLKWQLVDTLKQVHDKKINFQVAFRHMRRLNKLLYRLTHEEAYRTFTFYGQLLRERVDFRSLTSLSFSERREQRHKLQLSNMNYVTKRLNELDPTAFSQELVGVYLSRYLRRSDIDHDSAASVDEWLEYAIQLERDSIQKAFEQGDMSRGEVKEYRENLLAIESTIQFMD